MANKPGMILYLKVKFASEQGIIIDADLKIQGEAILCLGLNDKPYLTFPIPSLFLPLHSRMLNNNFFRPSPRNCQSPQLQRFLEQLEILSNPEKMLPIKPFFQHKLTT